MHLLFIEDDDLMGRAATQAFPTRGLSVTWVRDSIAARAAMEAEQFDLILLDLSLPGISGQEFLQRLRESGDQIPVVVVTARSEVSDRIRILTSERTTTSSSPLIWTSSPLDCEPSQDVLRLEPPLQWSMNWGPYSSIRQVAWSSGTGRK